MNILKNHHEDLKRRDSLKKEAMLTLMFVTMNSPVAAFALVDIIMGV